jgi:hypothetical protein
MQTRYVFGMLIALPLALNACKKEVVSKPAAVPPPVTSTPAPPAAPAPAPSAAAVTVTTITLGNAINTDRKVTAPSESFTPKDTIYAAIDTTGAGTATLRTKWTYRQNGQETVVNEDTQTIAPTGPATTEFHISKPDGWPAGQYQVQVLVNDQPAGTKTFTVK